MPYEPRLLWQMNRFIGDGGGWHHDLRFLRFPNGSSSSQTAGIEKFYRYLRDWKFQAIDRGLNLLIDWRVPTPPPANSGVAEIAVRASDSVTLWV